MASHTTHIRRIYGRPWRNGSRANPGKIPTCIQVSVRPETTGTLETMFEPCAQFPARRTDGVARHLRAQGSFLPQASVSEPMQANAVPTAFCLNERHESVAGVGIGRPQCVQSGGLLIGHIQSNGGGAHHALTSPGDMPGPTTDRRQTRFRFVTTLSISGMVACT